MGSTKRVPGVVGWIAIAVGLAVAGFFGWRAYRAWNEARVQARAQATYVQASCLVVAARGNADAPQWDVTFTSSSKILHATITGSKGEDVGTHRVGAMEPCFYPPTEPKLALWSIPEPPAPALLVPGALALVGLVVLGLGVRVVVRARPSA